MEMNFFPLKKFSQVLLILPNFRLCNHGVCNHGRSMRSIWRGQNMDRFEAWAVVILMGKRWETVGFWPSSLRQPHIKHVNLVASHQGPGPSGLTSGRIHPNPAWSVPSHLKHSLWNTLLKTMVVNPLYTKQWFLMDVQHAWGGKILSHPHDPHVFFVGHTPDLFKSHKITDHIRISIVW